MNRTFILSILFIILISQNILLINFIQLIIFLIFNKKFFNKLINFGFFFFYVKKINIIILISYINKKKNNKYEE